MGLRFDGKVALVTGASRGIGRTTALAFAGEGAKVVVASRGVESGEEILEEILSLGGEGVYIQTDVTKADQVEKLINATIAEYGQLDCAFNNAGGGSIGGTMTECSEEDWDHSINLNLKSTWLCMKYEIRRMIHQGYGSIVNNSSVDGLRAYPANVPYSASKHGIIGLTRSAALGYIDQNIRVNVICPSWIRTERIEAYIQKQGLGEDWIRQQQPMGRLGEPEEVAQTVLWLCSDASSFITGQIIGIEGGYLL